MKRKRVLVIPHVLNHPVKIRDIEIAKALANRGHDVTLLSANKQKKGINKVKKFAFHLRNLKIQSIKKNENLTELHIPSFSFDSRLCKKLNNLFLNCLCKTIKFDVVINAGYSGEWALGENDFVYIIDIVDDHTASFSDKNFEKTNSLIFDFYKNELPKADHIVSVSSVLSKQIRKKWNFDSVQIPNGANLILHRNVSAEEVDKLKQQYQIENSFVFGYVGGMDSFIDFSTVNLAFSKVREKFANSSLVWIGGGVHFDNNKTKIEILKKEGIILVGPISPDFVHSWIGTFNVGLIPKIVSPLTNAMMPIKCIEYSAAKLAVLASPMSELKRMSLPNVTIKNLEAEEWSKAMISMIENPMPWQDKWDDIFDLYDWDQIAQRFEKLF